MSRVNNSATTPKDLSQVSVEDEDEDTLSSRLKLSPSVNDAVLEYVKAANLVCPAFIKLEIERRKCVFVRTVAETTVVDEAALSTDILNYSTKLVLSMRASDTVGDGRQLSLFPIKEGKCVFLSFENNSRLFNLLRHVKWHCEEGVILFNTECIGHAPGKLYFDMFERDVSCQISRLLGYMENAYRQEKGIAIDADVVSKTVSNLRRLKEHTVPNVHRCKMQKTRVTLQNELEKCICCEEMPKASIANEKRKITNAVMQCSAQVDGKNLTLEERIFSEASAISDTLTEVIAMLSSGSITHNGSAVVIEKCLESNIVLKILKLEACSKNESRDQEIDVLAKGTYAKIWACITTPYT